jgi:hypothetical protein
MKPPLGEGYVAWASDEATARWLKMVGKDPDQIAAHQQRLAAIRARGYAAWQIASSGSSDQADLSALMVEYAAGDLTPARERVLLARMAESMPSVDTADFADEQEYDIGGLMAPVLGKDGNVVLLLRLAQLPTPSSGEQIKRWASDLRAAAADRPSGLHDSIRRATRRRPRSPSSPRPRRCRSGTRSSRPPAAGRRTSASVSP